MTSATYPIALTRRSRPRIPQWRHIILGAATLVALFVTSTLSHLSVMPPTGSEAVGRQRVLLVDPTRPEIHTVDPGDHRSVPLEIWYPAVSGTGDPADYVDQLPAIADGLVESGSVNQFEVSGLSFVRSGSMAGATPTTGKRPLVLLSPGNQTNVAFYASIAEDLASHGYLVLGIDHPFQVAATMIGGGAVAVYDHDADTGDPAAAVAAKIDERVDDVLFVLESLRSGVGPLAEFASMADLERIGLLGHSNGGLAVLEVCRIDLSVDACINMDGQGRGGPLGHVEGASTPAVPFLYLTKETELHPVVGAQFESASSPAVRAVLPDAQHDSFTDGPLFQPGLNPLTTTSQRVMTSIRSLTLAFFDQWLGDAVARPYDGLNAPADVYINVYPLGAREGIPTG